MIDAKYFVTIGGKQLHSTFPPRQVAGPFVYYSKSTCVDLVSGSGVVHKSSTRHDDVVVVIQQGGPRWINPGLPCLVSVETIPVYDNSEPAVQTGDADVYLIASAYGGYDDTVREDDLPAADSVLI